MILIFEFVLALMAIAALAAFVSVLWWALVIVLLVVAVLKYRQDREIRKYEADVAAGRRKPFKGVERCDDCNHSLVPCDACVKRHQDAEAS
ncbi:hypothetical protein ACFC1L_39990 [Streptomyces sp. NPDC056210]|uniref:hypothetical protein n=1 Tax=Streptomyces sp. NPDC056210 TaxID=3345746 RepID=UPI0035E384C8